jgi:peroxiredoxin
MQPIYVAMILALGLGATGLAPGSVKAQFEAIMKAQAEASSRYHDGWAAGKTPEEKQAAVNRYLSDYHKNAEAVLELVGANPKDPIVVDALRFVIRTAGAGPGDESYRAMEILVRDHVRDPGMGELCGGICYFFQAPITERLIRSVMTIHPNRDDRGLAYRALATHLRHKAKMARRLRENHEVIKAYEASRGKEVMARFLRDTEPDALDKESESLLERVIAEFGDVKHPLMSRTEGTIAAGELFGMRNLAVGKVAPDIEGKDQDGTPFALSEYRGKVVVLTFSGNWCGPCVAMYPHERKLVSRLKNKPFVLLSVSTDKTVDTLKKAIGDAEITWRCWYDGGVEGPITTRWGIPGFPSIFVLDKRGVIRFMNVRGADLDNAVNTLLE